MGNRKASAAYAAALCRRKATSAANYGKTFLKWAVIAACIGLVGGLVGAAFHMSVNAVTTLRGAHPWLLYLMPPAGFLVVWVYRVTQMEGKEPTTLSIPSTLGRKVPLMLTPVIFLATVLTHVVGSAGREGQRCRSAAASAARWDGCSGRTTAMSV